jgi:hypothetical protein
MPRPGLDPDEPWRRPDDGGGLTDTTNPTHTSAPGTPSPSHGLNPSGGLSPGGPPAPSPGQVFSGGTGGYSGPPPTTAPPPGWRPPVHLQGAPPRQLPAQDLASLEAQEQQAQRVTWTVGAVAGAILVVLTCLLCTRLLF